MTTTIEQQEQHLETDIIPNAHELSEMHELDAETIEFIDSSRVEIEKILRGESSKLLIVFGPCSVDATQMPESGQYSFIEFAERVAAFKEEHADELENTVIVLRGAVAKPRTHVGQDGLDSRDPVLAHHLITEAARLKLPIAMEFMSPEQIERYKDRVSLGWIGARDVNSTKLRNAASNTPEIPMLIKNGATGDVEAAHNAQRRIADRNVVSVEESVPGVPGAVVRRIATSPGNPNTAVLLRGGKARTPEEFASGVFKNFEAYGKPVFIDASHGNALAHDHEAALAEGRPQTVTPEGVNSALEHIARLSQRIPIQGVMFEANLLLGKDGLPGQTETDPGIAIDDAFAQVLHLAREIDPTKE